MFPEGETISVRINFIGISIAAQLHNAESGLPTNSHHLRHITIVSISILTLIYAACAPTFELPDVAKTTLKDAGYSVETYQKSPSPEKLRFGLTSAMQYDQVWCVIGNSDKSSGTAKLFVVQRGLTWRILYPALIPPGDEKYAFTSVDCTI